MATQPSPSYYLFNRLPASWVAFQFTTVPPGAREIFSNVGTTEYPDGIGRFQFHFVTAQDTIASPWWLLTVQTGTIALPKVNSPYSLELKVEADVGGVVAVQAIPDIN